MENSIYSDILSNPKDFFMGEIQRIFFCVKNPKELKQQSEYEDMTIMCFFKKLSQTEGF